MNKTLKIGLVGAGIGGITAALALQRRGISPILFEQSPKLGDKDAWKTRLSQGLDKLVYSALNGKGSMGAQSGGEHSDEEIKRAVIYLSNSSGGNF